MSLADDSSWQLLCCLSFVYLFMLCLGVKTFLTCSLRPLTFLLFGVFASFLSIVLITPCSHFLCQVSECNWPSRQAPSLHNLFAVCKNMHNWLKQNPKNVCVITCSVRRPSHLVLLSYIKTAVTLPTLHPAIFPSAF